MTLYLDRVYQSNLIKALSQSMYTRKVVERIAARNPGVKNLLTGLQEQSEEELAGVVKWKTDADTKRFEQYEKYWKLYTNDTDDMFPEWLPTGKSLRKRYNICRFQTTTYLNTMMGGGVTIKVNDPYWDSWLTDEVKIQQRIKGWAINASVKGFCGVQIVEDERGIDLLQVDPDILWPVFDEGSDDLKFISKKYEVSPDELKIPEDVNYVWDEDKDNKGHKLIFEERHYRGVVEYFLYEVENDKVEIMLDPRWYYESLPELDDDGYCMLDTGVDDFMLQIVPNIVINGQFLSDYDDIVDLQRDINLRATQIDRVLNVHADPKMTAPSSMLQKDPVTGQGVMRVFRDEVLFYDPEDSDQKPEYLTWQSQLTEAEKALQRDINTFCTISGISPAFLVRDGSAFPDSAVAYRMQLTPTFNVVEPKVESLREAIQRIVTVLIKRKALVQRHDNIPSPHYQAEENKEEHRQDLSVSGEEPTNLNSQFTSRIRTMRPSEVTVYMKRSLPQDDRLMLDRLDAGVPSVSLHRVLKEVDGMADAEIEEELKRIKQDQNQMNGETGVGLSGFDSGWGGNRNSGFGDNGPVGSPQSDDFVPRETM